MVQAAQVFILLMCLSTYYVPDAEEQVVSKRVHSVSCLKGRQILDHVLMAYMNGHTHGTEVLARSRTGDCSLDCALRKGLTTSRDLPDGESHINNPQSEGKEGCRLVSL